MLEIDDNMFIIHQLKCNIDAINRKIVNMTPNTCSECLNFLMYWRDKMCSLYNLQFKK